MNMRMEPSQELKIKSKKRVHKPGEKTIRVKTFMQITPPFQIRFRCLFLMLEQKYEITASVKTSVKRKGALMVRETKLQLNKQGANHISKHQCRDD